MEEKMDVFLRPIELEDAEKIVQWRNSEQVKQFFIYQNNLTVDNQKEWINTKVASGEVIQFIIMEKETQKGIGTVYLRDVDRCMNKAEYGIFIGEESARGNGYGTQVAKLMIKYAFEELNLHRLYLRVFQENERAIKSYLNAGFEIEGVFKDDVFIRNNYRNIVWMGIINPQK